MKKLLPFALAAALAAPAFGQATSKPVGYETVTLRPETFNFFGLRLAEAAAFTGTFESGTADTLVDDEADFTGLVPTANYILELPGGAQIVATGSSFAGTTVSNLAGSATGFETSAYTIRKIRTLTDVFGTANEAGLLASISIGEADVVLLVDDAGVFQQYFYNPGNPPFVTAGWKDAAGDPADPEILSTDGIIVQSRSTTPVEIVVTGSVILESKAFNIRGDGNFNFYSSVFPAGSTLDNSGLVNHVTASISIGEADVVLMVNEQTGVFEQFFYNPGNPPFVTAGWKDASGDPAGTQPLLSSFIIERRAAGNAVGVIAPPASYSSL